MKVDGFVLRVVSTLAGVSGAVLCAVSAVLVMLWVLDSTGPLGSLGELLTALATALAGLLLLALARLLARAPAARSLRLHD